MDCFHINRLILTGLLLLLLSSQPNSLEKASIKGEGKGMVAKSKTLWTERERERERERKKERARKNEKEEI